MKITRIIDPEPELLARIIKMEEEAFEGDGNVDLWIIKALIRYGLVFVLEENGEIVSVIEYMQKFNEKKVFLYGISTLKEFRRKGYANFLLKTSEEYLKELNFKKIELTVAPENEMAIKLYNKHGYKKEKFLKDEYGENIDRFVMGKRI